MKDVLLINTPISSSARLPDPEINVPPIGLGYIYTKLKIHGIECQFLDAVVQSLLPQEIIEYIDQSQRYYIGLNVFSSNISIVQAIVERVEAPRHFLLGGPAIHTLISTITSWKTRNNITIISGEAENIVPRFIGGLVPSAKLSDSLRLVRVDPGSPDYPMDIDCPLDRSIFRNEPIQRPDLNLIEAHIITSRGCKYNCAFCTAAQSMNPNVKPRHVTYEYLCREVEDILHKYPETTCIRILDDLFLRDRKSIDIASKLFSERNISWRSMAHVNTFKGLSYKELDEIKRSGCNELFLGIESGNDETLKRIRKPFTSTIAYETVSRIIDAQIPVKCYFILGFPGETESQVSDTLELASRLKEYANTRNVRLRISPFQFRPYHGTSLYTELVEQGVSVDIRNRIDLGTENTDPFDCIAGIFAEYDQETLDQYLHKIKGLSS